MPTPLRALIVEDADDDVQLLVRALRRGGYELTWRQVETREQMAAALEQAPWDIVIADHAMPHFSSGAALQLLQERGLDVPFIIVSGTIGEERAVEAMRAGAHDYILKGNLARLLPAIDRELAEAVVRRERRRAEEALRQLNADLERRVAERTQELTRATALIEQERQTLEAVMGSMTDGLLLLDQTYQIRYCNAQAAALLGLEPAELVGRTGVEIFALTHERFANPEGLQSDWAQALSRVPAQPSFELSLVRPESRTVQTRLFPVTDRTAAVLGIGVLLHDVTTERELARTKDELVAIVSHELRTPLASLVGFAELLLERGQDYREDQRREFVTIIHEEGRRLTALINDFLDLQRLESGAQQFRLSPIDLGRLLERAVTAAGPDPARPIDLVVPEDLPWVTADPDRIHQVVGNLLSNARKYSPEGGRIRVQARVVDSQIEVAVVDQGLGIPPAALPRLFEKFYRVDASDRRAIGGTGLGLAICRKTIEAHGGRIRAESEGLGRGTRLTFTLPVAQVGAAHGEVLVIEDDARFARLLATELAARGLSAVWASSAEAALGELEVVSVRALVLDLLLPGIQGEAFLRRLRSLVSATIPVVVVTVKDLDAAGWQELAQLRVTAVLRKGPRVAQAAAETVARAIADQTMLSEGSVPSERAC